MITGMVFKIGFKVCLTIYLVMGGGFFLLIGLDKGRWSGTINEIETVVLISFCLFSWGSAIGVWLWL